ncbi:MAG: plastocyanin/azurin family copper-binding protein [Ginsengibacter sp.]
MKKLFSVLLSFICFQSYAAIQNVNVENFQFTPSNFTAVIGDVVHFIWVNGPHTTSSITVPVGAAAWDATVDSENATFDYTITTAGTYTYFCKVHGAALMSATFTVTGVAPVTLSSFNIIAQNNKPFISWSTQAELNADHFSIRKSTNGVDFKEIGRVAATGNSSVKKTYSFSDETIAKGISYVYYELATIDKDGKTQLSPIKIFKNKNASPKIIISLSPNPIGGMGHLMLQFNADRKSVMIARLVDIQGKIILKTELSAAQGVNNGHIHLGDVQAGIYTLYLTLDGISESHRLVKN